jgi:hypothetical protein
MFSPEAPAAEQDFVCMCVCARVFQRKVRGERRDSFFSNFFRKVRGERRESVFFPPLILNIKRDLI